MKPKILAVVENFYGDLFSNIPPSVSRYASDYAGERAKLTRHLSDELFNIDLGVIRIAPRPLGINNVSREDRNSSELLKLGDTFSLLELPKLFNFVFHSAVIPEVLNPLYEAATTTV